MISSAKLVWSPFVRAPILIGIFVAFYVMSGHLPLIVEHANPILVREVLEEVTRSNIDNVSRPEFAYALASEIVRCAVAIAFALLLGDVVPVRFLLWRARRKVEKLKDQKEFEANYDALNQSLAIDPLIGAAWFAYSKTQVSEKVNGRVIRFATVRPQSFFNSGLAREHMFSLRLMPSIPGYFVGLGLLLTFIGLVIALSKASHGTGASANDMTQSLRELLNAATFKFSTSIAGLFSSIALSIFFRSYGILIDMGFDRFCRALEARTSAVSAQALAIKNLDLGQQQLLQLREMNTDQYFRKLGEAIAPTIGTAVAQAVEPLSRTLEATATQMENATKTGTEGLLEQFSEVVQGSAGRELREISAALASSGEVIRAMQEKLASTGDAFATKIESATDNFARLVADATEKLSQSSIGGKEAVEHAVQTLTSAAQEARHLVQASTEAASKSATGIMEEGLRDVLAKVGSQMDGFGQVMSSLQEVMTRESAEAAARSREVIEKLASSTAKASEDGAGAIRSGIGEMLDGVRTEVARAAEGFRVAEEEMRQRSQEQMEVLQSHMRKVTELAASEANASVDRSRAALDGVMEAASKAASHTAEALRSGMGEVLSTMRSDVERLSSTFKETESAMSRQAEGLRLSTERSESVALSFGKAAEAVGAATQPLVHASSQIATSAQEMSQSLRASVVELHESQGAARQLAESLLVQHQALQTLWSEYSAKFERVDASLAAAVGSIIEESNKYQESIKDFVGQIDTNCGRAITGLSGAAAALEANTTDIAEALQDFLGRIAQREAAE
ncbi:anti-phage ZorAB system protein ZorA [Bradyrhizobium zhanjiangense]|uniref:anti-phage ZorAB system protein ZorA n=1 Tax=Bradyrhizobium zhanjiangense TaxID=1325107 RepID=UPI00100873E4|nr:anti-phage ZorAB system protein ZorA [Bradyrhizobium zhanjiangense]